MAWFERLTNVVRAGKLRAGIDEELQSHVEARRAQNLATGMSPEEARADALRRFGGRALMLDQSHDANVFAWLETILQDLRYGVRNLRRNPGVTAVGLLSLALAICANTAIFSAVNAVLLREFPYKDPGRIAILWVTSSLNSAREINTSIPIFEDWKTRSRTLQDLAIYREADAYFTVNAEPSWLNYAYVHGDFFRLWGRSPILGRVFDGNDADSRQVVLSHGLWRRHFNASPDVIGRSVVLSGTEVQIVGVMPQDFAFPSSEIELWAPASALPDWPSSRAKRQSGFGRVAGRLRPGVNFDQARAEMQVINRQLAAQYPSSTEERGIRIVPLQVQINGQSVPFMLAVLFSAVFLVLLIACANVANLLLARGAVRRSEIVLRTALGAGRIRIARQLLTESMLLSVFAGALALAFSGWAIRALVALAPPGIARLDEAHIDGHVLAFSLGLSLAAGILFGLAPALRISREVSPRRQITGIDSRATRRVLAVAEIALAVILLSGAGLLIRSFIALESVDPGFHSTRVLAATLRFSNTLPRVRRAALYHEAMARINQLPGVKAAGAVSTMFFSDDPGKFGLRAVEGRPAQPQDQWTPMTWDTVSGDYFQALGIPLLRGRFFTELDTKNAPPVVIVNESMARRYWSGEDPIGKGIKGFDPRGQNDEWVRVVGVVKDMRSGGLEREPIAQIYEAQAQSLEETENLVVRTDLSAAALRETIRSVDKAAVWSDVTTLNDRLREQTAPRRFQTLLLSLFAAAALLLAGAGLFGMMHYSVAQRTQEIGIRMALGARSGNVLRMILGEGGLIIGTGLALGLAGSLALTRAIRGLLFGVAPADPLTLCAVAFVLASIALLACFLPARRATRIDPILALRCE